MAFNILASTRLNFFLFFILTIITVIDAKPPKRLIGGSDAAPGEIVYQVSLRLNREHHCGGVLISTRHVLTAAHCVVNSVDFHENLRVYTGTNSLEKGGQESRVADVDVHRGFAMRNDGAWGNDIAVVTLEKDIELNSYQAPVALPSSDVPDHVVGLVSGWGLSGYDDYPDGDFSTILQKSEMSILGQGECQRLHKTNTIDHENVCGFKNTFSGVCKGDEGSPLVYNGTIVGILSWYYPCALGLPDVYTRVFHYLEWILEAMIPSFHHDH